MDGIVASNYVVQEDHGLVLDPVASERYKSMARQLFAFCTLFSPLIFFGVALRTCQSAPNLDMFSPDAGSVSSPGHGCSLCTRCWDTIRQQLHARVTALPPSISHAYHAAQGCT